MPLDQAQNQQITIVFILKNSCQDTAQFTLCPVP